MWQRVSRVVSLMLAGALFLAGCGDESASAASSRDITVFAATSLTDAFTKLAEQFEAARDVAVTLNFAASSALVQQLREGARADVVALADTASMDKVRALVRSPSVFARNRLVVATKDPKIRSLADLAAAEIVSLCGADIPCGRYAAEALTKAGVTLDEARVTRGQNVAATLAAVTEGDATAAVVYATDLREDRRVTAVPIPRRHNVSASYPIATRRDSAAARAFVAFVKSDRGQRVLRAHGFLAP